MARIPKVTDNQLLMQYQDEYLKGDKSALNRMYTLGKEVAERMIRQKGHSNPFISQYTEELIKEKAHNASTYIIEQYLKRPNFIISKSYSAYIYLRVVAECFHVKAEQKYVTTVDIDTGLAGVRFANAWTQGASEIKVQYSANFENRENQEPGKIKQYWH